MLPSRRKISRPFAIHSIQRLSTQQLELQDTARACGILEEKINSYAWVRAMVNLVQREGKTDGEIEDASADKGQVLFTVEEFRLLATWLREEVLSGRSTLPYHLARPMLARLLRLRIRR